MINQPKKSIKSVVSFCGLDPCGGAGISADIEVAQRYGIKLMPILTALTVQNTCGVFDIQNIDANFILKQFTTLKNDINPSVIKIGLVADAKVIDIIGEIISQIKIPIVCDTIIKSNANNPLMDISYINQFKQKIISKSTIITPNRFELAKLLELENDDISTLTLAIQKNPLCKWVLVTSLRQTQSQNEHWLFYNGQHIKTYANKRLAGQFHGSGCSLASAIAMELITKNSIIKSCSAAINYTYNAIFRGYTIGNGQSHLNHFIK